MKLEVNPTSSAERLLAGLTYVEKSYRLIRHIGTLKLWINPQVRLEFGPRYLSPQETVLGLPPERSRPKIRCSSPHHKPSGAGYFK